MANSINEQAIKKLKLLFTVVDRNKGEFFLDVISEYEVNCQMVMGGLGTAHSELVDLLGLNNHKAVILSILREDLVDAVMSALEEKRKNLKGGQGMVSFAVPMSSVVGVNLYQFLSNNRLKRGE